ncbi:hypothetical protein PL373_06065 [Tenacibaculum maritimum]|nr:hypothetical protein [Tenacibaculum maritimum]MDB0600716.1 hypothetical protein [Tenacibaculum maritimum]MDB0612699.1 hypothetical protein [Tenacibaculum maritimum]
MIPEEKKYQNKKTNANSFLEFNPKERWRQMLNVSDGTYFVSDFGRIMRLNPRGIFNEIKLHVFDNELYAPLEHSDKNRKNNRKYRVAKLVLKYFAGGNKSSRHIKFLDNNKLNTKLSNLRYKTGFINEIDYKYISKIDGYKTCDSSRIVIRYLFTEKPEKLIKLIQTFKSYIMKCDRNWKVGYFTHYQYMDFVLDVIEDIKSGGFKPTQNKYTDPERFKKYIINVFGKKAYLYRKSKNMNLPLFNEFTLDRINN